MNLLETTKFLMRKYQITASKSLGQNFLIQEEVIENAIKESNITKEDLVFEIGPGLGTLTNELLKYAGKVIAIELDGRMIEILKERFFLFDNLEIIAGDVLKLDLNELIAKNSYKQVKIVANLPYYITTPIIMKLLESKIKLESITVMVQKEVADRLCAQTGTREAGAITYAVEYYANAKKLFTVPNTSFLPMPKVESEVIMLEAKENQFKEVTDEKKLFQLIKYAFMQRRKTLLNSLQGAGIPKETLKKVLAELGINEKARGEELSLEDFIKITNALPAEN